MVNEVVRKVDDRLRCWKIHTEFIKNDDIKFVQTNGYLQWKPFSKSACTWYNFKACVFTEVDDEIRQFLQQTQKVKQALFYSHSVFETVKLVSNLDDSVWYITWLQLLWSLQWAPGWFLPVRVNRTVGINNVYYVNEKIIISLTRVACLILSFNIVPHRVFWESCQEIDDEGLRGFGLVHLFKLVQRGR